MALPIKTFVSQENKNQVLIPNNASSYIATVQNFSFFQDSPLQAEISTHHTQTTTEKNSLFNILLLSTVCYGKIDNIFQIKFYEQQGTELQLFS